MPHKPKVHRPSILKLRQVENRPNSYDRGYDSKWVVVRKQHLLNNPICLDCLKEGRYVAGQEVHHIKKLAEYPELRDVSENLMTLCKSCHSKRTARGE